MLALDVKAFGSALFDGRWVESLALFFDRYICMGGASYCVQVGISLVLYIPIAPKKRKRERRQQTIVYSLKVDGD